MKLDHFGKTQNLPSTPFSQTLSGGQLRSPQIPQSGVWVHLLEIPTHFSYDEALLLCEHSEHEWLAWSPDVGEIVLHSRQFCLNP